MATRRGDSLVSTWLYRIATNAAIDRLRAASRREVPVSAAARTSQLKSTGAAARRRAAASRRTRMGQIDTPEVFSAEVLLGWLLTQAPLIV
jgi:DNA-directed RNA polymerase specialized sigma24 family protein